MAWQKGAPCPLEVTRSSPREASSPQLGVNSQLAAPPRPPNLPDRDKNHAIAPFPQFGTTRATQCASADRPPDGSKGEMK